MKELARPYGGRRPYSSKPLAIAVACLIATAAAACRCASHEGMAQVSVDELSALLAGDEAPVVVDANSSRVRIEYGTIPGAVLLTNYGSYDVASELPADTDTPLVFYCSNTRCSAAPKAAERATQAGYTEVRVLPEGIKGWVEAGKPVDDAPPTS
jgi:rhodanese-related sulfurtransferase